MSATHERALEALAKRGRLRSLRDRRGADFASNDYLALAESDALADAARAALERGVPTGSGGSRLLRGNHEEHEALEREAAAYFKAESALFLGGGFVANTAILSTLPQRGDLVVYDELIHASAHDGMRLGRAATVKARHNDAQAFDDAITTWRQSGASGQPWIVVESLYSMDGDRAPLADLLTVSAKHDAMLVIDEAHATGVYGTEGRGLASDLEGQANVISLHTCGKALGVMGALVIGPKLYKDFLVNRARGFIYATAPSPLIAATVRAALTIVRDEPERRHRLHDLVRVAGSLLAETADIEVSNSQIQPIIVGSDTRAVAIAETLQRAGYDIRAIRPPTVPEGTARLRLTITLHTDEQQLAGVIDAIGTALREHPA